MKNIKLSLFLILPMIFLYIGFMMFSEIGAYHYFVTDPEYAYLFNGLNILNFSFPDQVNGPGTTLQLYCALIIKVTHILFGQDSLNIDVLKNPDFYLQVINNSLIVLTSITIALTGYFIYKSTKNFFAGIFIQLTAFTSWLTFDLMHRIMVENMVFIGVLWLIVVMFKYIYHDESKDKTINKYLIWFSIIIGFICSSKLMYLPIAIIPFLSLNGYKRKLYFILFTFIAFSIFSYAIFNRWNAFFNWYWDNFVHTGQYGSGSTSIIDLNSFKINLKSVFFSDGIYFKAFITITIAIIIYHIPFFKIKKQGDKSYLALLGIYITMVTMNILVAKQFKYYYLFTAILLEVPAILLICLIFSRKLNSIWKTLLFGAMFLFVAYYSYYEAKIPFAYHNEIVERRNNHIKVKETIQKEYNDKPTLVIADYYGAPYKEYGLFFGMAWTGNKMASKYAFTLNQLYPDVFIYHDWNKSFNQWNKSFSFIEFLKTNHEFYLYSGDKTMEKSLKDRLHGINRQIDTKFETVKTFENIKSVLYKVSFDSIKNKKFLVVCDAETIDSSMNHYISKDGIPFANGSTRSDKHSKSGKYCAMLSGANEYGMTAILSEVKKDEKINISVWRYRNGNSNAGLVVSTENYDYFSIYKVKSTTIEGNWEKLEININVDDKLDNQNLRIFCWNTNKTSDAFFDDLSISIQK